jgi:hypothetical protein
MSLGVKDPGLIVINGPLTITISPLFHLVPIAVIITLVFTWLFLSKKLSKRPLIPFSRTDAAGTGGSNVRKDIRQKTATQKTTSKDSKIEPPMSKKVSLWHRINFKEPIVKNALIVLLLFVVFVLLIIMLAYPAIIYQTISGSYQSHSPFYNFVQSVSNGLKAFAQVVSPIGALASAINGGLIAISPSIRNIGLALGSLTAPLANLDGAGKYLAFQNAAAWISVMLVLFYTQFARKSYRRKN